MKGTVVRGVYLLFKLFFLKYTLHNINEISMCWKILILVDANFLTMSYLRIKGCMLHLFSLDSLGYYSLMKTKYI